MRIPLIYTGQVIGELIATGRTPGEPLTEPDLCLLNDLARQISFTAETVRLSDDLERARFRIVEAEEETRRRLGSDLHDGVGHQLTGLARKAERAASLLEQNISAARELLTDIQAQLDQTILQVRQLAQQLYPPELELLGLLGALRERIQANDDPSLIVRANLPETLPPLPTAIESAVYYITLEALTNVTKHAGATSCELKLTLANGGTEPCRSGLELEVLDSGKGMAYEGPTGLGLLSMQARAGEVGGVCTIGANPGGGTRIWFSKQVEGCHRLSLMRKRVDQGAVPIFATPIRSRKPSRASEQHRRGGNAGQKWLGIGQKVAEGGAGRVKPHGVPVRFVYRSQEGGRSASFARPGWLRGSGGRGC